MKTPKLRFKGYGEAWSEAKIKDVLRKVSKPVLVDPGTKYAQIGIRSHGKGIFHKDPVTGESLGDKRVFWVEKDALVLNIVFAWEQAVAVTTDLENGMVASHRFPMYVGKDQLAEPNFVCRLFLTRKGKGLLELASPGGAGRNKTLGQKEFEGLKMALPSPAEQRKIADFLKAVDVRIAHQENMVALLKAYKRGISERIFRQEIRFVGEQGEEFPDWEETELGIIAAKVKSKNKDGAVSNVLTNSAAKGIVSQAEYFDREIVSEGNLHGYYVVNTGDFVYNPRISVTAPVGPIKRNKGKQGVMSPLYTVFRFTAGNLRFFEQYFETREWHSYMRSVANSGARHDRMNVSNEDFFSMPLPIPSPAEQEKIASFLEALDSKISAAESMFEMSKNFREGLMQQMFV